MRFTIRDLIWATIVVALGTSWWQRGIWEGRAKAALHALNEKGPEDPWPRAEWHGDGIIVQRDTGQCSGGVELISSSYYRSEGRYLPRRTR